MLTSSQLSEWEAYDSLEPIGEQRNDYHVARIMATIINMFRWAHGKKGIKMVDVMDCMAIWDSEQKSGEQQPTQSIAELKSILTGISRGSKKRIERKKA